MNRQRLDFESLRDSMLAVAGTLDLRVGGVPFLLTSEPSVPRRTVYGFIERGRIPGMLSYFDFPTPGSARADAIHDDCSTAGALSSE